MTVASSNFKDYSNHVGSGAERELLKNKTEGQIAKIRTSQAYFQYQKYKAKIKAVGKVRRESFSSPTVRLIS